MPHWCTVAKRRRVAPTIGTRTAVAKSNILVNAPIQAKYFYQDLDKAGGRLNGSKRYRVTFAKDQTPPVHGFWSLTLYSNYHFFVPNEINRYSVGTKNKDLTLHPDGTLTIVVQADPPPDAERANWLPAPKGEDFSLFMRAYWPQTRSDGSGTAVRRIIRLMTVVLRDRSSPIQCGTRRPGSRDITAGARGLLDLMHRIM